MKKTTKTLATALAAAGLLVTTVGCETETGEEGNLRFSDESPVHDGSIRPIAAGRTVSYEVSRSIFQSVTLAEASSSDDGVFAIDGFSGDNVTVEGVAPGTATLQVLTDTDVSDRIQLEVREAAGARWQVYRGLANDRTEYARINEGGQLRVRPDDEVELEFLVFRDSDGNALSGRGGTLEFGETQGDAGDYESLSSGYLLRVNAASDEGEFTIPYEDGDIGVRVADALAPEDLLPRVGSLTGDVTIDGNDIIVDGGALSAITFEVLDADGFKHVGSYDLQAVIEIDDPSAATIAAVGDCTDTGDDGCVRYESSDLAQLTVAAGNNAGETDITVTVGDYSEVFTLTITERAADEATDQVAE